MTELPLRLILSNIRGAGNVGAMLRTANAAGVELVYAAGYTPYPSASPFDTRPPHVAASNTRAIAKTALGAERTMPIQHTIDTLTAIQEAKRNGFKIIVVEQAERSLNLYHYQPNSPIAIVLGNEVSGLPSEIIEIADAVLELPMLGSKESLNVASAAAITLYQLRFGQTRPSR